MGPKVYISGKLYDKSDAKISVFDHGLLYGDGVFEGIRSYSDRVFRLQPHVVLDNKEPVLLDVHTSQLHPLLHPLNNCRLRAPNLHDRLAQVTRRVINSHQNRNQRLVHPR